MQVLKIVKPQLSVKFSEARPEKRQISLKIGGLGP